MSSDLSHQLKKCSSLEEMNNFLGHLEKVEKATLRGHILKSELSNQRISLQKLKDKIINLHKKELSQPATNAAEVHQRTSSAIFQLQKMTAGSDPSTKVFLEHFGSGDPLTQLEFSCIRALRKDPKRLETLIKNYNQGASGWNALIGADSKLKLPSEALLRIQTELLRAKSRLDPRPVEEIRKQLEELEYKAQRSGLEELVHLNRFLGLSWTSAQREGREAVPLYGELNLPEPPASHELKDCENMAQLLSWLHLAVANQTNFEFHKEYFKLEGGVIVRYQDIEERILRFLIPTEERPVADLFLMAYEAIVRLSQLKPQGPHTPPKQTEALLQGIQQRLLKDIQNDHALVEQIKTQYTKEAQKINCAVMDSRVFGRKVDELYPLFKELQFIEALADILGIPLNPAQKRGEALVPEFVDVKSRSGFLKGLILYSRGACLINYERVIRAKWARLEELERIIQGEPHMHRGIFLESSKRESIEQEYNNLKSELEDQPKPMSERIFISLVREAHRAAGDLGIKLTQNQLNGAEPLPVIGREIREKPAKQEEFNSIKLLNHVNNLKVYRQWVNGYITLRELKRQYREHPFHKDRSLDSVAMEDCSALKAKIDRLGKNDQSFPWEHRVFFPENERQFIETFAELLFLNDWLGVSKNLNEEQLQGRAAWPEEDFVVAQPPPEKILYDLAQSGGIIPEAWEPSLEEFANNPNALAMAQKQGEDYAKMLREGGWERW